MAERIDIEQEFPAAIRRADGQVVAELLPTKSPDFDNADYVFLNHGVIAELKCLTKNVVLDPDFTAKLGKLYAKLMRERRAPVVFGRVRVSLEQIARFDERAAFEFLEPYKKRLAKVLEKANTQIKETARHFQIQQPKGLLVLANDGDMGLELDLLLHLLSRLLRDRYRSINAVLYFTANADLAVNVPDFQPSLVWMPLGIPGRTSVDESLLTRLRDAWFTHVAALTGGGILAKAMGDGNEGANLRFTNSVRPRIHLD
ncbi:MAG TPA: hypothetical protein VGI81_00875 [Tepidisphaeraceae bacterium]|jgi:hypothetical protein